jgi:TetR/AcrR family fatty acid metabolism transcriptional regulator
LSRSRQGGKHQKILKAAVKIFARKGFYNARVSEIAREANVADGTIYLYFKNKDDILIHLFEEEMDLIIQAMREEVLVLDDPLEKLRVFVKKHLQMVEENPCLAEVIQVELRQSNKFMKDYRNQRFREYLNLLADIVLEGQRKGLFRLDVNPSIVKRVIFGALDEMSTFWVLAKQRIYSVEDVSQQINDILINGVAVPDLEGKILEISSNTQGGPYVRQKDHVSHGESDRPGDH